jgi:hypothetical protein
MVFVEGHPNGKGVRNARRHENTGSSMRGIMSVAERTLAIEQVTLCLFNDMEQCTSGMSSKAMHQEAELVLRNAHHSASNLTSYLPSGTPVKVHQMQLRIKTLRQFDWDFGLQSKAATRNDTLLLLKKIYFCNIHPLAKSLCNVCFAKSGFFF